MKLRGKVSGFLEKMEGWDWLKAIRQAMLLAMPIILVGCTFQMLLNFPLGFAPALEAIQKNSMLTVLMRAIVNSTSNILSFVLILTISYSYGKLKQLDNLIILPVAALCTYILFSMDVDNILSLDMFQISWQMNAILFSVLCSALYVFLYRKMEPWSRYYAGSTNPMFNTTMQSVLPVFLLVLFFIAVKCVLLLLFGISNLQTILSSILFKLFDGMGNTFSTAVLFVFLKQFMWFFGIHGSQVLDYTYYVEIYQDSTLGGGMNPSAMVFSEPFFSNFVSFGGCGTLLCLLLAVLLFTKNKNNHMKQIAKFSALPMVFNINEMMLFGLPVVFNVTLMIPFILVPLVITCISYVAMYTGLVPAATSHIGWTVPVFISGYIGTGSFRGVLLQLFNVLVGILIYKPFVIRYEKQMVSNKKQKIERMEAHIKACEEQGIKPKLAEYELSGVLEKELERDLKEKKIKMYYQPQVNSEGCVIGAEALLRWEMEEVGYLYPPLVIALAQEAGLVEELNRYIIEMVCGHTERIRDLEKGIKISFNISADQLDTPLIVEDMKRIMENYNYGNNTLGLEITEQTAMKSSREVSERISRIREMGIDIIMDDFGMGHSSMVYLKDNEFDLVKIDGSLVRNLTDNSRCADIIASIVQLSDSLGFEVLAEYVETLEQQENLKSLNCNNYQGYLYSKPVPFQELVEYIKTGQKK